MAAIMLQCARKSKRIALIASRRRSRVMAAKRKSKRVVWPSTKRLNAIIPKSNVRLDVATTYQGKNLILFSDHNKASKEVKNDLRSVRILAVPNTV